MGIFDDIMKVVGAFKNAADQLNNATTTQKNVEKNTQPSSVPTTENKPSDMNVWQKIEKIVAENFSQYELKKNVSPTTIGGTGKFLNYSYGIYQNGNPKLFIMIVDKNTCKHKLYRWSKEQAEKQNITLINFIEHFPNEMNYIKERLSNYL